MQSVKYMRLLKGVLLLIKKFWNKVMLFTIDGNLDASMKHI